MRKALVTGLNMFLALFLLFGISLFNSCSAESSGGGGSPKDADVEIEANVDVNFATMVLAYDEGLAEVTGLGSGATYSWYLDNSTDNLRQNGAACTVVTSKLSEGKHTLLVVATLDGKTYSEKCTITITKD